MMRIKLHLKKLRKIKKGCILLCELHTQNKTLVQFLSYGFMKLILNKNVDEILI